MSAVVPGRNSGWLLLVHRGILWRVTRNDLAARYAGSLLGTAWVVVSPLLLLAVYAFVYLAVFRIRVPGLTSLQYVLYIFAGLVPFLSTSEALALGVGSVVAGKSVLSSTVFPIDLVPVKAVLVSQATLVVGLVVVLLGSLGAGTLHWTAALVPVLFVLQAAGTLGAVWILSLLNVVFRDLQNLLTLLLTLMLVASPIAYSPGMVPPNLRIFVYLNPFAYLVTAYQKVLVLGQVPGLAHSVALACLCLGLFAVGGWAFARGKRVVVDYV